jgi:hypothetical protein
MQAQVDRPEQIMNFSGARTQSMLQSLVAQEESRKRARGEERRSRGYVRQLTLVTVRRRKV